MLQYVHFTARVKLHKILFLALCLFITVEGNAQQTSSDGPRPNRSTSLLTTETLEKQEPIFLLPGVLQLLTAPTRKEQKPLLNVKSLYLDDNGYINVTIENAGGSSVPGEKGVYNLFVNGRLVETNSLSNIPVKEFNYPGGVSNFRTGIRLHGQQQRVGFHIDANKEIPQIMRYFNILTQTFTPERRVGFDLAVTELTPTDRIIRGRSTFEILLENQGTTVVPAGQEATIRVTDSNNNLLFESLLTLEELQVGEQKAIHPAIYVPIYEKITIDVEMVYDRSSKFDGPAVDLDNTNNHLQRSLYVDVQPYVDFINTYPQLIAWNDGTEYIPYSNWSDDQKADLFNAITLREQGIGSPLQGPPEVVEIHESTGMTIISNEDAWQIYLSFIAHYLWLEINNKLPWSFTDPFEPGENMRFLGSWYFIIRPDVFEGAMFNAIPDSGIRFIAPWNPLPEYEFLHNFKMIGENHEQTIYAFTEWMRGRLSHFQYLNGTAEELFEQFEYEGKSPPPERILYPLEGRKAQTVGCTTTSGLYAVALATVNIPVGVSLSSLDWYSNGIEDGGHTRPLFPTIGKTMGHGDDPYHQSFRPYFNAVPVQELFFEYDPQYFPPYSTEYPAVFDDDVLVNGTVDCNASKCNTVTEQLTYLYEKDLIRKNLEGLGGYLLISYLDGSSAYSTPHPLDFLLTGPFVKPYFSGIEKAIIRQQLESQLVEIGDGNRQRGADRVRWRYSFFNDNLP